jgi:poly-gamma-glutamate synthesis protein (capsule biosynthesis protein)
MRRLVPLVAMLVLAMPASALEDWSRRLNVAGFALANNHALDLGPGGLAETRAELARLGIPAAGQGERLDLPGVSLVMLTDFDSNASQAEGLLTPELLDRLLLPDASRPVVAFVHWGQEWRTDPGPREMELAQAMRARGVAAIVGAHPHAASGAPRALGGGDTLVIQSLGNFLFDQTGPRARGALAELRSFAQGTVFLRRLPLPQLYDLGRAVAAGQKPLLTQGQPD